MAGIGDFLVENTFGMATLSKIIKPSARNPNYFVTTHFHVDEWENSWISHILRHKDFLDRNREATIEDLLQMLQKYTRKKPTKAQAKFIREFLIAKGG